MTGKDVLNYARTAAIVTVLAVLLWVVAEGESLTRERIESPVSVVGDDDAGTVIQVVPGTAWSGRLFVELDGAASAVSLVRDMLRAGITIAPGIDGVPTQPGEYDIRLADVIRGLPGVGGTGITIASVEPESVRVQVERMLTRDIDIAVELPSDAAASSVVVEPRRVRLSYPSSAADTVDRGVEIVAAIDDEQARQLQLGERSSIRDVPLTLPQALLGVPFVRLDPQTVSVIVTLETREDSVTLDSVPVRIQRPAFQADRWLVRVNDQDQLLTGVTVSGPSELIDRIRRNDLRIFATVSLTADDLDARITEKPATFSELPTPLRFDVARSAVRLDIRESSVADRR